MYDPEYENPIDPNPALATRVVFPQSGRSRPEKRQFFHIFPHFSYSVIYQIKADEMPFRIQQKIIPF